MSAPRPPARTCVVTGASSGLGRALALDLAAAGWRVVGTVRRSEDGERLRAASDGGVAPLVLDVRDATALAGLARDVGRTLGDRPLDALVNNAGVVVAGPLEELDLDRVRDAFDVNVLGALAVTRALLPLLRREGGRGRVVNVGSISAHVPAPFLAPYGASKAALGALSRAMRIELAPTGIDVCVVEPGNHRTDLWRTGIASLDVDSPRYGAALRRARDGAARRAAGAADVGAFVAAVRRLLDDPRPPAAVVVGRDAAILSSLRRWLPYAWFETIVRRAVAGPATDTRAVGAAAADAPASAARRDPR